MSRENNIIIEDEWGCFVKDNYNGHGHETEKNGRCKAVFALSWVCFCSKGLILVID